MKIKRLSPSMTEVELASGLRILYSYEVPAAAFRPARPDPGNVSWPAEWVKTDKFVSRTTQEHIQTWLKANGVAPGSARAVPHDELERIAGEV